MHEAVSSGHLHKSKESLLKLTRQVLSTENFIIMCRLYCRWTDLTTCSVQTHHPLVFSHFTIYFTIYPLHLAHLLPVQADGNNQTSNHSCPLLIKSQSKCLSEELNISVCSTRKQQISLKLFWQGEISQLTLHLSPYSCSLFDPFLRGVLIKGAWSKHIHQDIISRTLKRYTIFYCYKTNLWERQNKVEEENNKSDSFKSKR